jgi:lipoprotein NlpI
VLKLADVYAVIAYYLAHRAEIDAYLDARRTQLEFDPAYQAHMQKMRERLKRLQDEKPAG